MKRTFIIIFISLFILLGGYFLINNNDEIKLNTNDKNIISKLKDEYNNDEIIGILEIPDVLKTTVVKHSDNDYYLTHDITKKENELGAVFMDYRVNIGDKKILIYGHNSTRGNNLPFTKLDNYVNESFYKKHPVIYLYTEEGKQTFDIFSSYVESEDFDYININDYNGLAFLEHINKLKSKSNYKIDINLENSSKIIILQTCNVESGYSSYKNTLVIGVLRGE